MPTTLIPQSRRLRSFSSLFAAFLLGGCATTYEVKVDSLTKPTGPSTAQSYRIKSKDPRLGEESLRYREAAEFVKTALAGKGLYEAPDDGRADMIVELDYGMASPRTKRETVTVPVYAHVGGGVTYKPVKVTDNRGIESTRNVAVYEEPKEQLVSYQQVEQQVTVYEKYITLVARENAPGPEGRPSNQLWKVQISAEDESKDIRKYLPIMASVSMDYIGTDSTNKKVVNVREDGPNVELIRRGLTENTQLTVNSSTRPRG
jgi:hypothetical protein